jgi:hypothetical protein
MSLNVPGPSSGLPVNDATYALAEEAAPELPQPPAPALAPEAPTQETDEAGDAVQANAPVKRTGRTRGYGRLGRRARRFLVPAWAVSLVVHVGVLSVLAATTLQTDGGKRLLADVINTALVRVPMGAEPEMTPILADPSEVATDTAIGDESAPSVGGSGGEPGGSGSVAGGLGGPGDGPPAPSNTPRIGQVGKAGDGRGGPGTGSLGIALKFSPRSLTPPAPGRDIGGGGGIPGDVTFEARDIGESLDQIAREILRLLGQTKLTVVWLFDESESMKDDQKTIRQKFDRVVQELKVHAPEASENLGAATGAAAKLGGKKPVVEPLNHAVVSFGRELHFAVETPTADIDRVRRAIDRLPIDESGIENTMGAISSVVGHYAGRIKKDRKLVVVLVTDESGDDGALVERTLGAVAGLGVRVYVIGRQSLFGYGQAFLRYIDPITKDEYWPTIRRGPETADVELLQWDGLHDRWDEVPSGFAPYELARLTRSSGGIYFLLPNEENLRLRRSEKAYKIADMREYVPEYKSREVYAGDRNRSDLRRGLYDVIAATLWQPPPGDHLFPPRSFPIEPEKLVPAARAAVSLAAQRLELLMSLQKRLEGLQKLRDREPLKRWQAHFDLILAQVVAYQVKTYEYIACLEGVAQSPPRPRLTPTPERTVEWVVDHSREPRAPRTQTAKKYAEANRLLEEVITRHPKTPWADLARDELDRGLSVYFHEWYHNPKYAERLKLVPRY